LPQETSTEDSSKDNLSEDTFSTDAQNKKRKRTHTKWCNLPSTLESDFDSIRDHLRVKNPSLIAKKGHISRTGRK
jgi:hypothetical protein